MYLKILGSQPRIEGSRTPSSESYRSWSFLPSFFLIGWVVLEWDAEGFGIVFLGEVSTHGALESPPRALSFALVGDEFKSFAHAVFGKFLFGFLEFLELPSQNLEGLLDAWAEVVEPLALVEEDVLLEVGVVDQKLDHAPA